MGMRLSRIWLARGIAVGVVAFVVGAWAVGLAIGKDQPAKDRETRPASPESSLAPSDEGSVMGEVEDRPSESASDELTDDPTEDPTDVVPAADTDDDADQPADDDPSTPKPSPKPSRTPKPSPSGTPTKTPSPSPGPTGPDCKDLGEVLDCVLAPITTRP